MVLRLDRLDGGALVELDELAVQRRRCDDVGGGLQVEGVVLDVLGPEVELAGHARDHHEAERLLLHAARRREQQVVVLARGNGFEIKSKTEALKDGYFGDQVTMITPGGVGTFRGRVAGKNLVTTLK